MNKKKVRNQVFKYLGGYGKEIKTKLNNISGKTGQYNVPDELFQRRTHRKNRVLISWTTVKKNNMTLEQLQSFSGGVVVEFVNNDFFDETNQSDPLFVELRKLLGGNGIVSSMITIRTEDGSSSSSIPRQAFQKLVSNTQVLYNGNLVTLTKRNYKQYSIQRNNIDYSGIGNDVWEGFLYVSIRGGQQDTITTHTKGVKSQLFNPACEFANEDVSLDMDLVMAYFALKSIKVGSFTEDKVSFLEDMIRVVADTLKTCEYANDSFTGNLFEYCENHPCLKMGRGKLFDPIQVQEIHIEDFRISKKDDSRSLDFTHDEAVNRDTYYWDTKKNCLLSPARPDNVFWSKHLSNMMQQNFSLDGYFKHEEEIVKRRKELLDSE